MENPMAILADKHSKVIVQGITGSILERRASCAALE